MSSANHTIKALGEGALDLQRRLEAAEGKAESLQRSLNVTSVHLELCLDAMASAVKRLRDGDGYCPAAALDLLEETLADIICEVEP